MSPAEFSEWLDVLARCPRPDEGGDASAEADLAWRALQDAVDRANWQDAHADDAEHYASAIAWAAFWLAAGAVAVAAIWRFAP